MNITFKRGGNWGGYIPDEAKTANLVLCIGDEIEIIMRDENLKELVGLTEEKIQSVWERCQKVVKVSYAQDELMRKFSEVIEKADMETMGSRQPVPRETFEKVMDAFYEFRNAYWDADIEASETER